MALKSCKECNHQISTSAKTCPNCGYKTAPLIGGGWIAIIVFIIIFGLLGSRKSPEDTTIEAIEAVEKEEALTKRSEQTLADVIKNTWEYSDYNDEISNKKIKTASITSNNQINLDFPYNKEPVSAYLTVRKHPRYGTDIMIKSSAGQLHCQYDNCTINVRVDEKPHFKVSVSEPADNDPTTYFLSNTKKTLGMLKTSKKIYIELTYFQQGSRTFEFNAENFNAEF